MSASGIDLKRGRPWPQEYSELREQLASAWGLESEVFLSRELSGPQSLASVYLADLTSKNFAGQAILKLYQTPDPVDQLTTETERHLSAAESEPSFAKRHLPRIVGTAHYGNSVAILSTVAGQALEFASPWSDLDYGPQLRLAQILSSSLMEDWNRQAELASGLQYPNSLLRSWLGWRLDPNLGALNAFLQDRCGFDPTEKSLSFEGKWYPNPVVFADLPPEDLEKLKLRALVGNVHGNLHGHNVLTTRPGESGDVFYLIDLSEFQNRQFLFYDHGCFALSYLLAEKGTVDGAHWQSILDSLIPFGHLSTEVRVKGEDVGIINLLKDFRQQVFDWVDQNQTHRLSYMENQFQLAQVAAGLNFASKPIDDGLRRRAFLFGASILKDYLRLHNVEWPKHGPAFAIEGKAHSSVDLSAADNQSVRSEPGAQPPALPDKPSIAVLAFENQSGDPEQEYFADGIVDEIIIALSRVDWLMVISRGTSFTYKGQPADARRIGKELGVHYLLEGAVRKAGGRARVTAHLVDTITGEQVWTERFDRDLDDIFELQEDVAEAIVAQIDTRLKDKEREVARRKKGPFTIWDTYQKAMWHLLKFNESDRETAKTLLLKLCEIAPDFSGGHAALAILELRSFFVGDAKDIEATIDDAFRHASRAVELDEGNSLAHIALSRVYAFQGKYDQAIDEADTAIALNPSSSSAYLSKAGTLLWGGRADEAMQAIDYSIRLSPKGPFVRLQFLTKGVIAYFLDDYPSSEELLRQSDMSRNLSAFSNLLLSAVYVRQERFDEARSAFQEAQMLRPNMTIDRFAHAWRTLSPRYREKLLSDLARAAENASGQKLATDSGNPENISSP